MTSASIRVGIGLALGIGLLVAAGFWISGPAEKPRERAVRIGDAVVAVDIARTPAARKQGLSGRASLGENAGMLFMMNESARHGFWMKDMRFGLDLVWLDDDGRIVDITPNAAPESFPEIFRPRASARYVLEVTAGFAARHGVHIGDSAVLPPGV